ncbi:hypothetical protein ARMGADRAFT_1057108 [Armillaria gallica]|uniref:Uncharacterized protein n=1 Tax=Armillaria gallica TaxID=47427 RepID=A0A2H3EP59_ARMGA|nr:hypothetical protein ARMGADRAFT_1057108 [Armillaria gallica]
MSSQVSEPLNIPADVFYEILIQSCDGNAAFFWLDYRRVSRNFHSAVENIFVAKYLRQTWIHVYSSGGEPARSRTTHTTEFEFSRLDPADSSRAIYTHHKFDKGFQEDVCRCLNVVFEAGPSLERPKIIVQVQQEVNDTMLPDFRYSFDPQSCLFEISFNWKGMYNHFFREQRNCFVQDQWRDDISFSTMCDVLKSSDGHVRMCTREERICRNVLAHEGRKASGEDYEGYKRVADKQREIEK